MRERQQQAARVLPDEHLQARVLHPPFNPFPRPLQFEDLPGVQGTTGVDHRRRPHRFHPENLFPDRGAVAVRGPDLAVAVANARVVLHLGVPASHRGGPVVWSPNNTLLGHQ